MINLQSECYININHHLLDEPEARRALGISCRYFHTLFSQHEPSFQISRLAQFIITNYTYFTNIDPNLSFNEQLGLVQVFLLGENHLNDDDRMLTGKFTQLVWKKNLWAFFVEGQKRNQGGGQIKYVSKEVVEAHESWDHLKLYVESARKKKFKMIRMLQFTSTFLEARDHKDEAKAFDILQWLHEKLETHLTSKKNIARDFFDLKEMQSYLQQCHTAETQTKPKYDVSKYFKLNRRARFELHLNHFFLYTLNLLTHLFTQYTIEINQLIIGANFERENQMANKTIAKVRLGQNVINVAGLKHTNQESQAIKRLNQEAVRYMSLRSLKDVAFSIIPNTDIELQQVREKLKRFHTLNINEEQKKDDEIVLRYYCWIRCVLTKEEQLCQTRVVNPSSKSPASPFKS